MTIPTHCPHCRSELEIDVALPRPGRTWGKPEDCYPDEPAEIYPESCYVCGTELDRKKLFATARKMIESERLEEALRRREMRDEAREL